MSSQARTADDMSPPLSRDVRLVLAALLLCTLISMLDQAIIATAGPTVVDELGGLSDYAWVFTAYMLAFSITMPVYGKLGDLFGRKPVYLVGLALFLGGSIACGAAQSMGQLIAFRTLQGLGGGGLVVVGMAILGDLLAPRLRARYQAWFAAVFTLANLAGPSIGGVITDQLGWRWVFFVNVPIGLVAIALLGFFLQATRPTGRPRIDYAGIVLLSGFAVTTVLVSTWGGTRYAWNSSMIVGLGALATLLLIAWFLVEVRVAEPLIPLRLFRNRNYTVSVVVAFAGSIAFFGGINFIPLFFQLVAGASPTATGLLFLPAMVCVAIASLIAGQVIGKTGRYRWFPVASMATALVGMALLSTMNSDTPQLLAAGYLALVGFGIGLSQQVVTLIAQTAAPPANLGVATSTVGFLRNMGVAAGAAAFGAITNGRLAEELSRRLPTEEAARLGKGSLTQESVATLPTAVQQAVAHSYATALTTAFRWTIPVLLLGLLAALLLKNRPLRPRGAPETGAHRPPTADVHHPGPVVERSG